jgi:hypothetical protein
VASDLLQRIKAMPEINYLFWYTDQPITFAEFLKAKPHYMPIRYDDIDNALGAAEMVSKAG